MKFVGNKQDASDIMLLKVPLDFPGGRYTFASENIPITI